MQRKSTRGSLSMYICMCRHAYVHTYNTYVHTYNCTHFRTCSNTNEYRTKNEKKKNNKEQWKPKSIKHSTAGVRSKDHHENKRGGEKIFAHVFTKKSDRRVGMILDRKFNGHFGSKFVPLCDRNGFYISRVLLIGWINSTLVFF